jgi:hypothetical protein
MGSTILVNEGIKIYKENEVPKIIFEWKCMNHSVMDVILDNVRTEIDNTGIKRIVLRDCHLTASLKIMEKMSDINVSMLIILSEETYEFSKYLSQIAEFPNVTVSVVINTDVENVDSLYEKVDVVNNIMNSSCVNKNYTFTFKLKKNLEDEILKLIADVYNRYGISSIIEPEIDIFGKTDKYSWKELDELYTKIIKIQDTLNTYRAIFISSGILPTKLMVDHPCNSYMCHGCKCHSEKNDICRKIIVTENGDIFPESQLVDERLKMGNLMKDNLNNILTSYMTSTEHQHFKEIVRECFLKFIQVCPYRVIPWTDLFVSISEGYDFELGES